LEWWGKLDVINPKLKNVIKDKINDDKIILLYLNSNLK